MSKKYDQYLEAKPKAVMALSAFSGLALYDILWGIDDKAIIAYEYSGTNGLVRSFHSLQIDYNRKGESFVRLRGKRYYPGWFMLNNY